MSDLRKLVLVGLLFSATQSFGMMAACTTEPAVGGNTCVPTAIANACNIPYNQVLQSLTGAGLYDSCGTNLRVKTNPDGSITIDWSTLMGLFPNISPVNVTFPIPASSYPIVCPSKDGGNHVVTITGPTADGGVVAVDQNGQTTYETPQDLQDILSGTSCFSCPSKPAQLGCMGALPDTTAFNNCACKSNGGTVDSMGVCHYKTTLELQTAD